MTKPYQPSFSIQPTYGFRYMSQPFAPNVGNINSANTGIIPDYEYKSDVKVPSKPVSPVTPQVMDSGDDNQTMDDPTNQIQTAMDLGYKDVYGPDNPASMIPGYGMLSSISGPAVPETGFGSPGSVSSVTGGIFDKDSRSYDPITGYYNPEYGTSKAFTDYMLNDPMGNLFGDTKNAFNYTDPNIDPRKTDSKAMQFSSNYIDSLPNLTDNAKELRKDQAATQNLKDLGFQDYVAQEGTPTFDAMRDPGSYTESGAAPEGSQYSKTGIFSSTNTKQPDPEPESTPSSSSSSDSFTDVSGSSYDGDPGQDSRGDSYSGLFSKGGYVGGGK